ncbi:MAG: hypothetical protein ACHQX3_05195, partial [Nitrospirales bacterium]
MKNMQASDIRNPNERNKLILAGALGLVAILFLWWTFFGFGSSSTTNVARPAVQPTPAGPNRSGLPPRSAPQSVVELSNADQFLGPIVVLQTVSAPEAGRNIFSYYEKPVEVKKAPETPTPTPTPEPPVLLASLSPATVFAKTGDFTLEVSGNKITPQLRVVIDNSELVTRYIGPQQLRATVPAALIANPGTRSVMLRSADGKTYSNTSTITINEPPKPNYTYIGILGTHHHIDTAILQDKSNKEIVNAQRGDLLGG